MPNDTLIRLDSGVEVYKSKVERLERHAKPLGFFIVLKDGSAHPIEEHEFWYYFQQYKFSINAI